MTRTRYIILPGDTQPYFVTATIVNWLPLFSNPDIAQIIFDALKYMQVNARITVYAYVLMENHLHMVASAEGLAKQMGNFKSYTARRSIDCYKEHENRYILDQLARDSKEGFTDRVHQFWQEGVGPKRIHDREMMRQKIEYMHLNPVKRGYVDLAEHWRYSSARNYAGIPGILDVCTDW